MWHSQFTQCGPSESCWVIAPLRKIIWICEVRVIVCDVIVLQHWRNWGRAFILGIANTHWKRLHQYYDIVLSIQRTVWLCRDLWDKGGYCSIVVWSYWRSGLEYQLYILLIRNVSWSLAYEHLRIYMRVPCLNIQHWIWRTLASRKRFYI